MERRLRVLNRLVEAGNTVVVMGHNMEVAKAADGIVDLGPGGGEHGGALVASGPPEQVAQCAESSTAPYLAEALRRSPRVPREKLVRSVEEMETAQSEDDITDAGSEGRSQPARDPLAGGECLTQTEHESCEKEGCVP